MRFRPKQLFYKEKNNDNDDKMVIARQAKIIKKKTAKNRVREKRYLVKLRMHIVTVNSSYKGTTQSLADRQHRLIDCPAITRNDLNQGLSKCH